MNLSQLFTLTSISVHIKENVYKKKCGHIRAIKFGVVVRGLCSIHEVLDSILISNIVNKKNVYKKFTLISTIIKLS
jgi:hypothetical protein